MKNFNKLFKSSTNSIIKIALLLVADVLFAILSFWLANKIMFYKITVDNSAYPVEYANSVLIIAAISIFLTIVMLFVMGSYRAIWKYAGIIDLFSFLLAYFYKPILLF